MKNIVLLLFVMVLVCPVILKADDGSSVAGQDAAMVGVPSSAKMAPSVPKAPSNPQKAKQYSSGELVDLAQDRNTSRLDDLDRRLSSMERGQRSQDENIRQMQRDIDDLKRGVQDFRSNYR